MLEGQLVIICYFWEGSPDLYKFSFGKSTRGIISPEMLEGQFVNISHFPRGIRV